MSRCRGCRCRRPRRGVTDIPSPSPLPRRSTNWRGSPTCPSCQGTRCHRLPPSLPPALSLRRPRGCYRGAIPPPPAPLPRPPPPRPLPSPLGDSRRAILLLRRRRGWRCVGAGGRRGGLAAAVVAPAPLRLGLPAGHAGWGGAPGGCVRFGCCGTGGVSRRRWGRPLAAVGTAALAGWGGCAVLGEGGGGDRKGGVHSGRPRPCARRAAVAAAPPCRGLGGGAAPARPRWARCDVAGTASTGRAARRRGRRHPSTRLVECTVQRFQPEKKTRRGAAEPRSTRTHTTGRAQRQRPGGEQRTTAHSHAPPIPKNKRAQTRRGSSPRLPPPPPPPTARPWSPRASLRRGSPRSWTSPPPC